MKSQTRRRFLRNSFLALPLPYFCSLGPSKAEAAENGGRLIQIFNANGFAERSFSAAARARFSKHTDILSAVTGVDNLTLEMMQRRTNLGASGPHGNNWISFFAGQPLTAIGQENRTYDQYVSDALARPHHKTRTISVVCDIRTTSDIGYSDTHRTTMSWKGPKSPVTRYYEPRDLFDVFLKSATTTAPGTNPGTGPDPQLAALLAKKKLVVDSVIEQIPSLKRKLNSSDQIVLDQYFTSFEEVDKATAQAIKDNNNPNQTKPAAAQCQSGATPGSPANYAARMKAHHDLLLLTMQCDLSPVYTIQSGVEGMNTHYKGIIQFEGSVDGSHQLSHWSSPYGGLSTTDTKLNWRDWQRTIHWQFDRAADLASRMKSIKASNGQSLMDSSLIVLSSHCAGTGHDSRSIGSILLGSGGGKFKTGTFVDGGGKPAEGEGKILIADLWLTIARGFGSTTKSIGVSRNVIPQLLK